MSTLNRPLEVSFIWLCLLWIWLEKVLLLLLMMLLLLFLFFSSSSSSVQYSGSVHWVRTEPLTSQNVHYAPPPFPPPLNTQTVFFSWLYSRFWHHTYISVLTSWDLSLHILSLNHSCISACSFCISNPTSSLYLCVTSCWHFSSELHI